MAMIRRHCDSIEAAITASMQRPKFSGNVQHWTELDDMMSYDKDWTGLPFSVNAQQTAELVSKGWTDGAKRIQENMEALEMPTAKSIRRRRVWSDQGDSVDMDRVRMGALETAWERMGRRSVSQPPRVTIYSPIWVTCSTKAEAMFWRGAAVVKLADALTEAGYNVEIRAVSAYQDNREKCIDTITVKPFEAGMDNASVASALALGAFLRKIMFRFIYSTGPREMQQGSGRLAAFTEQDVIGEEGQGTVIVAPMQNDREYVFRFTREDANRWIKDTITKLQGTED